MILGIWDGHDAGAALLANGEIVAAVNEERYSRRKLEIRFPHASIRACLDIAGVNPAAITCVAASTTDPAKALGRLMPWTKEQYYAVRRRKAKPGAFSSATVTLKRRMTEWRPNAISRAISATCLRRALASAGLAGARLQLFDHHACHAHAAAQASGFDTCVVVTIDGLGDGVSSSVSTYGPAGVQIRATSAARHSLGVFFEHVTHLLNMRELEDEGKVMALADYAAPVPDAENPLLGIFSVQAGRVLSTVPGHAMTPMLARHLWSMANEQFAFVAQRTVERVCVDLVRSAIALTGLRRVALAGGVASNIKANRLIRLLPELEDVYVFPHMGDGGLALGAALAAARDAGQAGVRVLSSLALGPAYAPEQIAPAARKANATLRAPADMASDVASRIADGQVVCWFQGRMEYGPRALGYRSVLARPDRPDLKDRLNLILKRRVWYQPFCPSILESEAPRIFQDWTPAGRANRHMTMAYVVAPEWRSALCGVTNIDASCRPQLVADDGDEPLAPVLRSIKARSGVGAVLNTSFNIHGEPLVCSPDDAFDVFRRSGADALAIGPYVVEAAPVAAPGRPGNE